MSNCQLQIQVNEKKFARVFCPLCFFLLLWNTIVICTTNHFFISALKNHLRIHSGERPYPCPNCPKSFRQRGDREKHIRARHSINKVDLQPTIAKLKNTHIVLDGPVRSKKELLLRNQLRNALKMQENAVQVGGVSFPKSMFRPILGDIDANVM